MRPRPDRAVRAAHRVGLLLTVVLAATGELFLGRVPAGQGPLEAVREFGYTLTALCLLGGYLLRRRSRRLAEQFRQGSAGAPRRSPWQEYPGVAFACSTGVLFGCLYWSLGGASVERHARTFIALGPPAYLALALRPSRWGQGDGQPA